MGLIKWISWWLTIKHGLLIWRTCLRLNRRFFGKYLWTFLFPSLLFFFCLLASIFVVKKYKKMRSYYVSVQKIVYFWMFSLKSFAEINIFYSFRFLLLRLRHFSCLFSPFVKQQVWKILKQHNFKRFQIICEQYFSRW